MELANNFLSMVLAILTVLVILVGIVAWFIRLESKVQYLEKDYNRHQDDQDEKYKTMWAKVDAVQSALNSVLQAIGRVEGKLESKKDS